MDNERRYAKELYAKEVVLKAAYAFTDCAYIHIDTDEHDYKIRLKWKNEKRASEEILYADFENELIAQETRRMISENTKNLREMIVARALSSTIVNRTKSDNEDSGDRESGNSRKKAEAIEMIQEDEIFSAADILQDWFEAYEK